VAMELNLEFRSSVTIYIGVSAKVLGPVTIGDESVIVATSVVLKDVLPRTVVAGVPSRNMLTL
jgi:serine acetyltransferase